MKKKIISGVAVVVLFGMMGIGGYLAQSDQLVRSDWLPMFL